MSSDPFQHGLPNSSLTYGSVKEVSKARQAALNEARDLGVADAEKLPTYLLKRINKATAQVQNAPNAMIDFMKRVQEQNRPATIARPITPAVKHGQIVQTQPRPFAPFTNTNNRGGGVGPPPTPFFGTVSGSAVTVQPGTVLGNADTTLLDVASGVQKLLTATPRPSLAITTTGARVVYLKLTMTHSLDNSGDYVIRSTYVSSEIKEGASLPSDDNATGVYYKRLFTLSAGAKDTQFVIANIGGYATDGRVLSTDPTGAYMNFYADA